MNQNNEVAMNDYLRCLRWTLTPLPAEDREGIVAELHSHFIARITAGDADFAEVARDFGAAVQSLSGWRTHNLRAIPKNEINQEPHGQDMHYSSSAPNKHGRFVIVAGKSRNKAIVSRYSCPIEGCDVMVRVTYDARTGKGKVSDLACDRQGRCGIPLFEPCPLYVDLVENRGVRKVS
jgi:hypothetical protein